MRRARSSCSTRCRRWLPTTCAASASSRTRPRGWSPGAAPAGRGGRPRPRAARAPCARHAEPDVVVAPDELGALDAVRYGAGRELRPRVLLNPGPALTTDRVKRAAGGVDVCHREPEYRDVEARVRRARSPVRIPRRVGRGAARGLGHRRRRARGDRRGAPRPDAARRAERRLRRPPVRDRRAHGIATATIDRDWTEAVEPAAVAAALAHDDSIDAVALVHHETTTGLLNPSTSRRSATRPACGSWWTPSRARRRGARSTGRGSTSSAAVEQVPARPAGCGVRARLAPPARRGRPRCRPARSTSTSAPT